MPLTHIPAIGGFSHKRTIVLIVLQKHWPENGLNPRSKIESNEAVNGYNKYILELEH